MIGTWSGLARREDRISCLLNRCGRQALTYLDHLLHQHTQSQLDALHWRGARGYAVPLCIASHLDGAVTCFCAVFLPILEGRTGSLQVVVTSTRGHADPSPWQTWTLSSALGSARSHSSAVKFQTRKK